MGSTLVGSPPSSSRRESQDIRLRHASVRVIAVDEDEELEDDLATRHGKIILEKDFCVEILKRQKTRMALQLIYYQDLISHNSNTVATEIPHSDLTHSGECLKSCLENGKLTMKNQKILQVLIAQSVLFFPWEGQQLNKSSILFHHSLSKPFAMFVPDHDEHATDIYQNAENNEPETYKPYNNEVLAALATTLLEIELRKPIDQFEEEQEEDNEDEYDQLTNNFWTTTRVLKEHQSNIYQDCYAAIEACLKCDFGGDCSSLDDSGVLQKVYDQIVAPLERELERGFGIHIPYFGPIEETGSAVSLRKSRPQKSVKIIDSAASYMTKELELENPEKRLE
jgi:hypothetical protein